MRKRTSRLLNILNVMVQNGIDRELLPKYLAPSYLLALIPSRRTKIEQDLGMRYFNACVELGPLFIKMGQMVSIRHDLFPKAIITPLAKLQDDVPPFDNEKAFAIIESELQSPLSNIFKAIDSTPLASASMAQVYSAQLSSGQSVVLKVLRPNIRENIKTDIQILKNITQLLSWFKPISTKTLHALIDEYQHTLLQEINLLNEACHYSQMKHNFQGDSRLYVPDVYWQYTTKSLLTMERIYGTNIDQVCELPEVDKKTLAYNGVSIFFTQVFKHRFFHADMHPGNVFIDHKDPASPKYIAIDFGIVGVISHNDQYYLAESFLGFSKRDYARIAKLHIEAGWVDPDTDVVKFETAIRYVCEPIFSRTIEEISIAELMHRLIEASKPFKLHIQPQLLMLQKTLFHVEALGRQLYPELNLWDAASPFLKEFMKKRSSINTGWQHLKEELPRLITHSPQIPYLLTKKLKDKPQSQPNPVESNNMIPGVILGMLIASPGLLTNPGYIYILSVSFIIMIAWKRLK